jgi:hypothetical protein
MPKTCSICGGDHYAKGFCRLHYKMPSQLNPKPIKRVDRSSIKQSIPVKRTPVKKVADRRAKELRIYAKLCPEFKKANPECQARLEGCTWRTTDVHHKKGKENELLNKVEYFLPVCRNCHDIIGSQHTRAKKLGLSIDRTLPE